MRVGSLARRYSLVVTSAMIVAVVWGGVAAYQLPREEEPKLTWRLANVVTRLPGASPERMESLVTDVLEHAIEQVDDVEHIYSVSRPGLSLIQIELRDSVVDAPPVWRNVRQKLSESALQLPRGSIGPELDDEIMGTFAMLIAVAGDDIRPRQLEEIAEELEDQLRLLDDTTSTSLFGTQREVIQIEPKPALLVAYDLSFQKLADIVQRRNTRQPSGRLAVGQSELLIEVNGELETEQDLREMVLMVTEDGRTVRLGDVAQLQRTIGTPKDPVVRANGQPSIVLGVRCRRGVRLDQYGKRVRDIVQQAQQGLPQGISLSIAHDLSKYTQERMRGLGTSMLIGVSLVFASLLVFMNWRSAIIVTLSIPLTALFVAITFSIVGIPLNEMSVMAVIMAMGLLVDNAIIVTEEVQHSPLPDSWQAAADAGDQLFVPLLVSTLTTVAAFLPIYLLPGGTGEFVRAIPLGVAICLITSLLVATTVVPQLCVMILPRRVSDGQNGDSYTTAARFIDGYRSILGYCCDHPLLLLGATTFAMVLCVCLGLTLRRDFFSPVQRDQFVIDVFSHQGSSLDHTGELVADIEALLHDEPQIVGNTAFIGRNAPLFFYNLTSQETYANHYAQLIVQADSYRNAAPLAARVQTRLTEHIAGANCVVHILEHGAPYLAPFEVRITGDSIPELQELGHRAERILRARPGVRGIRSNYGNESVKLVSMLNEPVARALQLDQRTVADELRYCLDGLNASFIQEGDERVGVDIRYPLAGRESIADLRSMYLSPRADGTLIPLSTLAHMEPVWESTSIYRRDGMRTLSVLAYPAFGLTAAQVSSGLQGDLQQLVKSLPPGYRLEFGGENEQRHEAEWNLIRNAIYPLGIMFVLLIVEFRSWRLSALIFSIIPLSLGGTMLGLWLTGWPLNFMAIMGMMMLIGVVVNDAILLVDGYERLREQGIDVRTRVVEGTLRRLRHVLVTTVTTVAGFVPLAITPSLLWPPLAIAIIGGLSLATAITLVIIPAAYRLIACE